FLVLSQVRVENLQLLATPATQNFFRIKFRAGHAGTETKPKQADPDGSVEWTEPLSFVAHDVDVPLVAVVQQLKESWVAVHGGRFDGAVVTELPPAWRQAPTVPSAPSFCAELSVVVEHDPQGRGDSLPPQAGTDKPGGGALGHAVAAKSSASPMRRRRSGHSSIGSGRSTSSGSVGFAAARGSRGSSEVFVDAWSGDAFVSGDQPVIDRSSSSGTSSAGEGMPTTVAVLALEPEFLSAAPSVRGGRHSSLTTSASTASRHPSFRRASSAGWVQRSSSSQSRDGSFRSATRLSDRSLVSQLSMGAGAPEPEPSTPVPGDAPLPSPVGSFVPSRLLDPNVRLEEEGTSDLPPEVFQAQGRAGESMEQDIQFGGPAYMSTALDRAESSSGSLDPWAKEEGDTAVRMEEVRTERHPSDEYLRLIGATRPPPKKRWFSSIKFKASRGGGSSSRESSGAASSSAAENEPHNVRMRLNSSSSTACPPLAAEAERRAASSMLRSRTGVRKRSSGYKINALFRPRPSASATTPTPPPPPPPPPPPLPPRLGRVPSAPMADAVESHEMGPSPPPSIQPPREEKATVVRAPPPPPRPSARGNGSSPAMRLPPTAPPSYDAHLAMSRSFSPSPSAPAAPSLSEKEEEAAAAPAAPAPRVQRFAGGGFTGASPTSGASGGSSRQRQFLPSRSDSIRGAEQEDVEMYDVPMSTYDCFGVNAYDRGTALFGMPSPMGSGDPFGSRPVYDSMPQESLDGSGRTDAGAKQAPLFRRRQWEQLEPSESEVTTRSEATTTASDAAATAGNRLPRSLPQLPAESASVSSRSTSVSTHDASGVDPSRAVQGFHRRSGYSGRSKDPVIFSLYAPPAVRPGTSFPLKLQAYLRNAREAALREALSEGVAEAGTPGGMHIRRGKRVTVELLLPEHAFRILPPSKDAAYPLDPPSVRDFVWTGETKTADFRIFCNHELPPGLVHCEARVVEGASVTRLSFGIEVVGPDSLTRSLGSGPNGVQSLDYTLEEVKGNVSNIPFVELEFVKDLSGGVQGKTCHYRWGDKDVAVKSLASFPGFSPASALSRSGLEHEATILSLLGHHPNIGEFYGRGRQGGGGGGE
ncbi:unnamed protein product, partial [Hapterophycus canaliculatus]